LASIFSNQGKHVEAVALYQRAIKADSNYLEAAQNLAEALIRTGNYADSIQVWRAIVTAAPSQLQATFRLSWILATAPDASVRRPFEARDIALKAIETTGGKHAVFYDSLAAAYSHLDNFEDAKEAIRKAAELQKDDPASLTVIRQRLALYENRQPFIDDRSVQSPAGGTKEPTTE
jgi:tetratricopeptide (TPR) repeat protein